MQALSNIRSDSVTYMMDSWIREILLSKAQLQLVAQINLANTLTVL